MNGLEFLTKEAYANMETRFVDNPNRGIVVGFDQGGLPIQLSWIMGRSDNSQNRVYELVDRNSEEKDEQALGPILRTAPADPLKVEDPSLIIYNAMSGGNNYDGYKVFVVSNGDQTDAVVGAMSELIRDEGYVFEDSHYLIGSLRKWHCEPDAPIFTPRITGIIHKGSLEDNIHLSLLRAEPAAKDHWINVVKSENGRGYTKESFRTEDKTEKGVTEAHNRHMGEIAGLNHLEFPTIRSSFDMPARNGFGYCLTTYGPGDSANLPSYTGEPFLVPLAGSLKDIMETFWSFLDEDWRVSLGGRTTDTDWNAKMAEPINRFKKVGVDE